MASSTFLLQRYGTRYLTDVAQTLLGVATLMVGVLKRGKEAAKWYHLCRLERIASSDFAQ